MRIQLIAALALLGGCMSPEPAGVSATTNAAPAEALRFQAPLSGTSEVPPNSSGGTGTAVVRLDPATRSLTWTVDYAGLTGPAVAAHIHGPAGPDANAGVMIPFTGDLASPIKGSAEVTDAQIAALRAGQLYVNIHTAAHPPGEIRGQLAPAR